MAEIPSWHITGDWFDNCSCAVACPCTFAQAPDNGFCESVLFWHIEHGHYGEINLDGLSFVRVGKMGRRSLGGEGQGTAGIFIDDRADERQAEVLLRIFGGQVGGFPALVAGLFTEGRQTAGRGARTNHLRDRARPRQVGNSDRRQSEGWATALTGPTSLPGKISAAHEPAWLRDRTCAARNLG